ncbi:uncharacterized protein LOC142541986 [Primulina tabacum]|uniref:uncharacterized protein LOC142541986 n=1 Tax=Primulina tabacum TaxID=48773 RepID=UPI003F598C84
MHAHLAAQDDDMWYVITDGPMRLVKANTVGSLTDGSPHRIDKPREEFSTKEIWDKLIQLCEGNEQTKENKLSVAVKKFDNIKMKTGDSMNEYDERVSGIINELNALEKVYSNKEVALEVVRGLPKE